MAGASLELVSSLVRGQSIAGEGDDMTNSVDKAFLELLRAQTELEVRGGQKVTVSPESARLLAAMIERASITLRVAITSAKAALDGEA